MYVFLMPTLNVSHPLYTKNSQSKSIYYRRLQTNHNLTLSCSKQYLCLKVRSYYEAVEAKLLRYDSFIIMIMKQFVCFAYSENRIKIDPV